MEAPNIRKEDLEAAMRAVPGVCVMRETVRNVLVAVRALKARRGCGRTRLPFAIGQPLQRVEERAALVYPHRVTHDMAYSLVVGSPVRAHVLQWKHGRVLDASV